MIVFSIIVLVREIFFIDKKEELFNACPYNQKEPYNLSLDLYSNHYHIFSLDDEIDYYAYENDEMIYPASLTKLMTLDAILHLNPKLDDELEIKSSDFELMYTRNASVAGLRIGQSYSIKDLLYTMVLSSGADACTALERYYSYEDIDLVSKMNDLAFELGMNSSHFANTTGLYEDDNYTTLNDLKRLILDLYNNPLAMDILSSYEYAVDGIVFYSTLYRYGLFDIDYVEVLGGKTGFTYESKQNIIVLYSYDGKMFCMMLAEAGENFDGGVGYHALDADKILEYLYSPY